MLQRVSSVMKFELNSATSTIVFNLPDHCAKLNLGEILPVRRPITPSKRTGRGKVADVRHECTLKAESINEFYALRLIVAVALHDKCVVQPFVLKFKVNGRFRRYIPDFLLLRGADRIVVEVKPDKQVAKPSIRAYFRLIQALLTEHGYKFVLWLRSAIIQEPRLNNVALMLKYRRTPVSESECEFVRSAIDHATSMTFAELSVRSGVRIQALRRLVLEGQLFVDWFVPFGVDQVVSKVPIGNQVWPSPQADLSDSSLDDDAQESRNPFALDEHAIALAGSIIASMSVNKVRDAASDNFAWWHLWTRRTFQARYCALKGAVGGRANVRF
jgi:hypothetical protein